MRSVMVSNHCLEGRLQARSRLTYFGADLVCVHCSAEAAGRRAGRHGECRGVEAASCTHDNGKVASEPHATAVGRMPASADASYEDFHHATQYARCGTLIFFVGLMLHRRSSTEIMLTRSAPLPGLMLPVNCVRSCAFPSCHCSCRAQHEPCEQAAGLSAMPVGARCQRARQLCGW